MKTCTVCKAPKDPGEFHRKSAAPDGLQSRCKACIKAADASRYERDVFLIAARNLQWKSKNLDSAREQRRQWKAENAEKVKQQKREWRKRWREKNPGFRQSEKAALIERCGLLTPEKKTRIVAIYAEARRLTEETGTAYHVDHIAPLRGKNICGLHIPENLRIITAEQNLKKGAELDAELVIESQMAVRL